MTRYCLVGLIVFLCAFLCAPVRLLAQTVTLVPVGGSFNVASAEDFATRAFQDPWDMNERTDFGWFLYGADQPSPDLTLANDSFTNGLFHATTGTSPNLFLLETGNPFAARVGKTGTNYPIDADTYRLIAIRMFIDGSPQAAFGWNQNDLWDGTQTSSNIFTLSPGWRTYLVDIPTLGRRSGPINWGGLIRSLQFSPSYQIPFDLYIDWIRLVNINPALCRQVTWSGFAGGVDLYLDPDGTTNGNETLLFSPLNMLNPGETSNASNGCSGSTYYTFYAGGLAPGSYQVLARAAGTANPFTRSARAYQVNAAPTLTITSPSEEGSADDFATARLGNAWDMDATSDVEQFINVTGQTINQSLATEPPAGTPLSNVRALTATSTPATVGDPILQLLSTRGDTTRIDPTRYRILTVEFGIPNRARSVATGSVARVAWRVAGGINYSVSDDIIFNSRLGANVMDKIIVDLADRTVLPIEPSSPSQLGWVPGSSAQPGIDRFRFDVHEFSAAVPFYLRRVKLAALELAAPGGNYTISWTASEGGTVTLYRDGDRNPFNGGQTLIVASVAASAGAGSFVWTNVPAGQYYIYAVINDNQGNSNASYSRWPLVVAAPPPTAPPNLRILH